MSYRSLKDAGVVDEWGNQVGASLKVDSSCEVMLKADAEKYGKEEVIVTEKKTKGRRSIRNYKFVIKAKSLGALFRPQLLKVIRELFQQI